MPLNAHLKQELLVILPNVYSQWKKQPLLDHRRKMVAQGPGAFNIEIENYKGLRTELAAIGSIAFGPDGTALEGLIKEFQPELLGQVTLPGQSFGISQLYQHLIRWCQFIDKQIAKGATLSNAVNILTVELEHILTSGEIIAETFAPISGLRFSGTLTELSLGPNLKLKALSNDELTELMSEDVLFPSGKEKFRSISVAAVFSQKIPIAIQARNEDDVSKSPIFNKKVDFYSPILSLVNCIHLIKTGNVEVAEFNTHLLPDIFNFRLSPLLVSTSSHFFTTDFSNDDLAQLKNIYEQFTVVQNENLKIAAGRLSDAENRPSKVDSLIDSVIGLEVLLNPVDNVEMSFRVALNYAFLKDTDRRARFENLKEIQKVRNRIVHGGLNLKSKDAQAIHANAAKAKECLRETILFFLKDPALVSKQKIDADYWLDRIIPK